MCYNASITVILGINNIYMYWIKLIYILNTGDFILHT